MYNLIAIANHALLKRITYMKYKGIPNAKTTFVFKNICIVGTLED